MMGALVDTLWIASWETGWVHPTRWYGDTAHFQRDSVQRGIRLEAPSAGKTWLWSECQAGKNASWEGSLSLDCNPSSSNYVEIRLSTDGLGNGYAVRLGASDDAIAFGKLSKNSFTTLAKSPPGILDKEKNRLHLRMERSKKSHWFLSYSCSSDSLNGTLQAVDSTFHPGDWFGFKCVYTSTRVRSFALGPWFALGRPDPPILPPTPAVRRPAWEQKHLPITEVLAAVDPKPHPSAARGEFIELVNKGVDTLDAVGWSVKINGNRYSLPPLRLPKDSVVLIADSALGPWPGKVWHAKVNVLSGGCWIQVIDNYGRTITHTMYDPENHTPPEKSTGGYSLEARDFRSSCFGGSFWSTSVSVKGSTPGKIPLLDSAAPLRPALKFSWWGRVDPGTMDFQSQVPFLPLHDHVPLVNRLGKDCDTAWLVNPFTLRVRWATVAQPGEEGVVHFSLPFCQGFVLDTTFLWGEPLCFSFLDSLRLTEVLLNPAPYHERFVEIYNAGAQWVDVGLLRLSSCRGIPCSPEEWRALAPSGTLLAPKSVLAFASRWDGSDTLPWVGNPWRWVSGSDALPFSDEGGYVGLFQTNGNVLDVVLLSEKFHHPGLISSEGHTLTRRQWNANGVDSASWMTDASGWGSPGVAHFAQGPPALRLGQWKLMSSRVGVHGPAFLYYKLPETAEAQWVANASVYSLRGERLYDIWNNRALPLEGELVWNGQTTSGAPAPPGTYFLSLSFFNTQGQWNSKSFAVSVDWR